MCGRETWAFAQAGPTTASTGLLLTLVELTGTGGRSECHTVVGQCMEDGRGVVGDVRNSSCDLAPPPLYLYSLTR